MQLRQHAFRRTDSKVQGQAETGQFPFQLQQVINDKAPLAQRAIGLLPLFWINNVQAKDRPARTGGRSQCLMINGT